MSTALRLNDDLVHEAETEGLVSKRSAPKQIEFWAQIGKVVAHKASGSELLALMQGFAQVQVTPQPTVPVDSDAVFATVEQARRDGSLSKVVSQARVRYEMSPSQPGALDRVQPDGRRETGHIRNGVFTTAK